MIICFVFSFFFCCFFFFCPNGITPNSGLFGQNNKVCRVFLFYILLSTAAVLLLIYFFGYRCSYTFYTSPFSIKIREPIIQKIRNRRIMSASFWSLNRSVYEFIETDKVLLHKRKTKWNSEMLIQFFSNIKLFHFDHLPKTYKNAFTTFFRDI